MKQCFCQLIKLDAPNSLCSASELFFRLHFRVLTPKTFVMSEPQAQDLAFPFEEQAKENGVRYWDAWTLMKTLGYESYDSFKKVILKAIGSCAKMGIETHEAFNPETVLEEGKPRQTYRLTRFACFLITLHADESKPQVAAAKVYFAAIAEAIIDSGIQLNDLERLELRSDLTDGENMMEGAAKAAGCHDPKEFAFFKSAGFRGMYNMNLAALKKRKGVSATAKLYDLTLPSGLGECRRL